MSSKGDALFSEAEKILKRPLIFGFGKAKMYEDAIEAFNKSGNAYKLNGLHAEAGKSYLRQAEITQMTDSPNDAVQAFIEAANSFRKDNLEQSVHCYLKAIDIYNDSGRFSQSAKYYKELAELYESDHNMREAINFYQRAADLFNNDNKAQSANQCLLKIATAISKDFSDLSRASTIFETIGRTSLDSRLGAFSAKGYFFQSLLCTLASGDNVKTHQRMDEYKSLDYSFASSRECELVSKLLTALENMDIDAFSQACADFDRISPLDDWKTSLLVRVRSGLTAAVDEEPNLT